MVATITADTTEDMAAVTEDMAATVLTAVVTNALEVPSADRGVSEEFLASLETCS